MEGIKTNQRVLALVAAIIGCWVVTSVKGQNGQISTPCTSSMMTTLTPCMNYITGSGPGGSARPSLTDCCSAFTSLVSNSVDCACLLVTASVPLPLSLSIPKICNTPLPLQCKASGTPLPAPGPLQFATPPPPGQQLGAPSPSSQFETPSPASSLSPQGTSLY
ncbi:hypothetical protein Cgig2_033156 [Carnegiea gigantea]|uniref:Bifunctional inhibitor/plant lipid transfer protein/seed storage helical domain-containing protein n=1 Tax=Carnegiea gigantea TaxID=171969 RepID=A0A9Q1JMU6_9CARY|nr:hypothetical protein Cgig2_033156 [Carnegiea gigantea]